MNRSYENDVIERESMTARKLKEKDFTSSYLAMGATAQPFPQSLPSHETQQLTWPRHVSATNQPLNEECCQQVTNITGSAGHNAFQKQSLYSLRRVSSPQDIPGKLLCYFMFEVIITHSQREVYMDLGRNGGQLSQYVQLMQRKGNDLNDIITTASNEKRKILFFFPKNPKTTHSRI